MSFSLSLATVGNPFPAFGNAFYVILSHVPMVLFARSALEGVLSVVYFARWSFTPFQVRSPDSSLERITEIRHPNEITGYHELGLQPVTTKQKCIPNASKSYAQIDKYTLSPRTGRAQQKTVTIHPPSQLTLPRSRTYIQISDTTSSVDKIGRHKYLPISCYTAPSRTCRGVHPTQ